MGKSSSTMEQRIAQVASAFEQQRSGHTPKSVNVVLNEDLLVIALRGVLSPAEQALAKTPAGITQLQEFHRQLFANASDSLRQEIERITGVGVYEAAAEVAPAKGAVMKVFTSGAVVEVFLLDDRVGMETWNGTNLAGGG